MLVSVLYYQDLNVILRHFVDLISSCQIFIIFQLFLDNMVGNSRDILKCVHIKAFRKETTAFSETR